MIILKVGVIILGTIMVEQKHQDNALFDPEENRNKKFGMLAGLRSHFGLKLYLQMI